MDPQTTLHSSSRERTGAGHTVPPSHLSLWHTEDAQQIQAERMDMMLPALRLQAPLWAVTNTSQCESCLGVKEYNHPHVKYTPKPVPTQGASGLCEH